LKQIQSHALDGLPCTIVLPSTVLFVASDVTVNLDRLFIAEKVFCDEFDGWMRVRKSGISVDFRRIVRFGFGLHELKSYLFDDSGIEEVRMIGESAGIVSGMSRRIEDNSLIVLNSIPLNDLIEDGLIEKEIEKLINLCHPCIASPIGFVLATGSRELKVLRLYSERNRCRKSLPRVRRGGLRQRKQLHDL
jgi:hypothetical protein